MKRRAFLAAMAGVPLAGGTGLLAQAGAGMIPDAAAAEEGRWRWFEITTRIALEGESGAAQLWLPLAQSAGDYQVARGLRWTGSGQTECVYDACYGAPILRSRWEARSTGARELEVVQVVAIRAERGASALLPFTEAERKFWTAPVVDTPLDQTTTLAAARIVERMDEPRQRLRALYDWVVDHTHRDPDVPGCGTGDYLRGLENSDLGGKCADINSLMVGLARAAGFPAREVYGLRVAPSKYYPSLGRAGDVSKAQHCRAEVFLDGEGWFPLDPADVRKVVLEQKIALDSAEGRALRDRMFGRWEMNWIGYNSATGLKLPGGEDKPPSFRFLMYPCGFTEQGQLPCLNPDRFRYEIRAREATV